jgi:hypothetical protein
MDWLNSEILVRTMLKSMGLSDEEVNRRVEEAQRIIGYRVE